MTASAAPLIRNKFPHFKTFELEKANLIVILNKIIREGTKNEIRNFAQHRRTLAVAMRLC